MDLQEIRALIFDYFARDLWQVIESPSQNQQFHLIIGERSDAYSAADRQHAMRIAASNEHVTVDVLPAGHWVHVEDPDGLMRTLRDRIKEG